MRTRKELEEEFLDNSEDEKTLVEILLDCRDLLETISSQLTKER